MAPPSWRAPVSPAGAGDEPHPPVAPAGGTPRLHLPDDNQHRERERYCDEGEGVFYMFISHWYSFWLDAQRRVGAYPPPAVCERMSSVATWRFCLAHGPAVVPQRGGLSLSQILGSLHLHCLRCVVGEDQRIAGMFPASAASVVVPDTLAELVRGFVLAPTSSYLPKRPFFGCWGRSGHLFGVGVGGDARTWTNEY